MTYITHCCMRKEAARDTRKVPRTPGTCQAMWTLTPSSFTAMVSPGRRCKWGTLAGE